MGVRMPALRSSSPQQKASTMHTPTTSRSSAAGARIRLARGRGYLSFVHQGTPSLKVSYQCGIETYSKWVCLEHQGVRHGKAEVWWRALAGTGVPHTVNEALDRQDEVLWPSHIRVAPDGKYWRIVGRRIDGVDYDVNLRPDWRSQPKPEITDEVLF